MRMRWYQAEAKQAIYDYLKKHKEGNPCAVLPTGAGKTPLLASICADIIKGNGRCLVLAHVKELLEQSVEKLQSFIHYTNIGIYSAGLKSRDTTHPIIVAGIQSVYKRAGELGAFDMIIVDEVHLIPAHEGGMYRTFIDYATMVNPNVRIVGLTATPYRLDVGMICGQENIMNDVAYEVGIKELIVQGYLCPLRTRAGTAKANLDGIHIRGGEYIESEVAERMGDIVQDACREIVELTADRKSVLIFASNVQHGQNVQNVIDGAGFIHGETPSARRADLLYQFKAGTLKYLVNVNVLTTGFDAPNVDAIALLRATLSPGLYYQMIGRGLRMHDGKENCIVLDYGENTVRHGPVDAIRITDKNNQGEGEAPAKECPECAAVVFAGVSMCPECGFEFPPPELKHNGKAGNGAVLSGEITTTEHTVERVSYYVHKKRGNDEAPTTMRVEYETGGLYGVIRKEWLCFNHEGYAREKACQWWRDRSNVALPATTEDAVKLANLGALSETSNITYKEVSGDPFGTITGYEVGEKPTIESVMKAAAEISAADQADIDEWGEPEPAIASAPNWWGDDELPF